MDDDARSAFKEAQDAIDEVVRVYETRPFDGKARQQLKADLHAVLTYYFGEDSEIGAKVLVKGKTLRATLIKPRDD